MIYKAKLPGSKMADDNICYQMEDGWL